VAENYETGSEAPSRGAVEAAPASAMAASGPPARAAAEYDRTFEELVQHVAAELPHFDAEFGVPAGVAPRVRRSGVYVRRSIQPPMGQPLPSGQPLPPTARPMPVAGPEGVAALGTEERAMAESMGGAGAVTGAAAAEPQVAAAAEEPALALLREELRVDVDGLHPTMTVSGAITRLFGGSLTWIARVAWDAATGTYVGPISYRDGLAALVPHTDIRVRLTGWWTTGGMRAHVTFAGGGQPELTRSYAYERGHFRQVGIEIDCASDATAVTSYNLSAHPNRPADLPHTTLSIEDAFTRQGIKMTRTAAGDVIAIAEAGANLLWSDIEMHDAMQAHWSRWTDRPQWQLWTLFAGQHEIGHSLGGIMFDDIGTAQRQGCAIFINSFISDPPPAGDPNPAAFVQRMRFWTAVHEIGHTFNLAHAWRKSAGTPWIPLVDEPEARSFMNYPYNVSGGTDAFFADFYYQFSDDELLFMRHAPTRFVRQGDAAWFNHHGFEEARRADTGALQLTLRVNRASTRYESLEPVVAELKLKNISNVPVVVDKNCLYGDDLAIIINPEREPARQWQPYARYCYRAEPHILAPGASLYAPCFLSAGRDGWHLAEPGRYHVYAALRTPAGMALSAPLGLRIDPPAGRDDERLAPDVFTEHVARVLAFGGSRVLDQANSTLRTVLERLPQRRIAIHAAAALAGVTATAGRVLTDGAERRFDMIDAAPKDAAPLLGQAYRDPEAAADTLGHIRMTDQVERVAAGLADGGQRREAADLTTRVADTLENRQVLPAVIRKIRASSEELAQ
jgi:hypothetical protein